MIKFPRPRILVAGAVLLVAVLALTFFLYKRAPIKTATALPKTTQEDATPKKAFASRTESQPAQPVNRQPVSSAGAAVHPITKAVVEAGLLAPVSRLNQVANFLTAGTESGALLFLNPGQTDRDILSTSFEAVRPDQSSLYASASFAAGSSGYEAVYDTVEYGTIPCPEVEKKVFSNLKNSGILKKNITVLVGGAVKVFLMTAGRGCVVIKKEVVR
jgi:hypothetical protein